MSEVVTIEVPAPWTRLKQGHHALSSGQSGFSAITDGHVWLTSYSGTFTSHSQGPHRAISTDDELLVVAKKSILGATTGGVTVASGGGIRVIAGHSADPDMSPADAPVDTPDAADGVTNGCDTVATAWMSANLAVNVLMAAKATAMALIPGPSTARIGGDVAAIAGVANAVSKVANAATNAAQLGGGTAPGINIHGTGGINLFTPAFASFYGMNGMLFASPFSSQVMGLATVGVVGLATAGMSSVGKADLASASGVSVVASGPVQVKSVAGEVVMKGSAVALGQVMPDKTTPAQLPTAHIGLTALAGMRLASPKGTVRFGRTAADLLEEMGIKALYDSMDSANNLHAQRKNKMSVLGAMGWIKGAVTAPKEIGQNLIGLQLPNKDPIFTMNNDVVVGMGMAVLVKKEVKLQVGTWVVTVNKKGIELGTTLTRPEDVDGQVEIVKIKTSGKVGKEAIELGAGPTGGKLKFQKTSIGATNSSGESGFKLADGCVKINGTFLRLS